MTIDLDSLWDEDDFDVTPTNPDIAKLPPQADEDAYTRLSNDWLDAREYNRNWDKARAMLLAGSTLEQVEHFLDRHPVTNKSKLSQVVTPEIKSDVLKAGGRLSAQSDEVRKHLRKQLLAARRRALKEGNPALVHKPWLDNMDTLYEFAGLPPNHGNPDGRVFKFTYEDTAGAFDPDNTLWMSQEAIQMRLSTRRVVFEGEDISLTELAKRCGLSIATVRARYDAGIRGERLWSGRRLNSKYDVNINGQDVSLPDLAKMCGVSVVTLRARAKRGLTGLELVSKDDMRTKGRRLKYNSDTPEDLIREEMKALTLKYRQAQEAENPNPREIGAIFEEISKAKRKLQDLKFQIKALEGDE